MRNHLRTLSKIFIALTAMLTPVAAGAQSDPEALADLTWIQMLNSTDTGKGGDLVRKFQEKEARNVLLRGIGVGSGCASGNVCTVNTLSDLESDFKDGNVIVTKMTTSEMLPYMRRASAVVVESTNPECHAAVACQAMGIPMMMDRTYQAVHMLKSGMMITVDADEGFIYNGIKA